MDLENEVKRLRFEKSSWQSVARKLQAELDETKATQLPLLLTLKHQVKCLKHCQAAGEKLRAELARRRGGQR